MQAVNAGQFFITASKYRSCRQLGFEGLFGYKKGVWLIGFLGWGENQPGTKENKIN